MPWSAPSPLGAPAYFGAWQHSVRPHTGSPGLLATRQPAHAYHVAPTYQSYRYISPPPYYDGSGYYTTPQPALLSTPPQQPTLLPTLPSPLPPSWDQAAFLQAMNNFAAQGTLGTDWIFDSGASSHMSASSNLMSSCTLSHFPLSLLVMVLLFPYTMLVKLKFTPH
jgi:hypothetical protein